MTESGQDKASTQEPVDATADSAVPSDRNDANQLNEQASEPFNERAAEQPIPAQSQKMPIIVASIAGVVAIAAIAVALLSWQQTQGFIENQAQSTAQFQLVEQQYNTLTQQQGNLVASNSSVNVQLEQLTSTIAAQSNRLNDQQAALQSLAEQIAVVRPDPDSKWLVAQSNGLLRLAEQQVVLANDLASGLALLRQARESLAAASDPKYFAVLQAIDDEILLLEGVERPQIAASMTQLQAMINAVNELPLTASKANQVEQVETEESWADWFTSLVTVSRIDEQATTLAPEPWLQASLVAQLQQARALIMLQEQSAVERQVVQLIDWLEYYVPPSSMRSAWLTQLEQLKVLSLQTELPADFGKARQLLNALEAQ